jgi:hypothetical protein
VVLATALGLSFYALSDSRRGSSGCGLRSDVLAFSACRSNNRAGASEAGALDLLGICRDVRLNVLTKGLIGLVFPAGAIGLYLLLTGNLRHLLKLRLVSSTLVFLAIAAPWHILAALRNPAQGEVRGFLWFYFINEHVMRFLNKRVPPAVRHGTARDLLGAAAGVASALERIPAASLCAMFRVRWRETS